MANNAKTSKAVAKRIAQDKEAMLKALQETPNVTMACKKSGVNRKTFYRWCKEDSDFEEEAETAFAEGIEFRNDMADSGLMLGVQDRQHASIMGWLKHNHPRYIPASTKSPPRLTRKERHRQQAEEFAGTQAESDIERKKHELGEELGREFDRRYRALIVESIQARAKQNTPADTT